MLLTPKRGSLSLHLLLFLSVVACRASLHGGFTDSCTHIELCRGATAASNSTADVLQASCRRSSQSFTNTTLDLNLCLGVDQTSGDLAWSYYYCSVCSAYGTKLSCSCQTLSGMNKNSTIDLDDGITNQNGTLTCEEAY